MMRKSRRPGPGMLSFFLLGLSGCEGCNPVTPEEDPALPAIACEIDLDCRGGEICSDGLCISARSDGGVTATNDAGTSDGGSNIVPADAGAFLEDAGQEPADAGATPGGADAGEIEMPVRSPWLLSVDGMNDRLVKIDLTSGETDSICVFADDANYPSTTFGLDGTLYGFEAITNSLDIIDPCTCEVTRVGSTEDANGLVYDSIPGITANGEKIEKLFGLSADQDKLLDLETSSGMVRPIGNLGHDFDYSGTTWSVELGGLYALNNTNDMLYTVDTETGLATEVVALNIDVNLVGIEYHSANGNLYVCTNSRVYNVDVTDGTTELVTELTYPCNNLAAPWQYVACIDDEP